MTRSTNDPIEAYVHELRGQLRAQLLRRRRILSEVHAHLRDAAEAEREHTSDANVAAARALARFGRASETATQFNRVASQRLVLLRRTLVPWAAALALTSMASASVWAVEPGAAAKHGNALRSAPAQSVERTAAPRRAQTAGRSSRGTHATHARVDRRRKRPLGRAR